MPSNSGGSNLGPTSKALADRVKGDVETLKTENPSAAVPVDLVTTSGSGLDPDISPEAAYFQVPRVAKARGCRKSACALWWTARSKGRTFGLLGEPRVNVLEAQSRARRAEVVDWRRGADGRRRSTKSFARCTAGPRQEGRAGTSEDFSRRRARRRQDLRHAHRGAREKAGGRDVVAGLIETHGRRETEQLIEGLEILPRKPIVYRNQVMKEFDLDAALARRPSLLLVDEYAHTNVPGSRHPKRWQDIDELLAAGIDVWTTLNIQHLESLNDVVQKITKVRVRETVPDTVFDKADEIVLVDFPPDELLKRLAEGKVYVQDTAARAVENFFKPQNLTALRELALRRAAERIDADLIERMQAQAIEGPWAAGERILACIGPDPISPTVVRTAKRLADLMDAPWIAVTVERPGANLDATRASAPR